MLKCKHCHAPEVYLQPIVEHFETATLQTVRCIRCGDRTSRPAPQLRPVNRNRETWPAYSVSHQTA